MIYNVVLNSNLRSNFATTTTSNAIYYFDWSVIPEGKYKLTWVFAGGPCDMNPLDAIPMLSIPLGQSSVFRVDPNATRAASSSVVGLLLPNILSDSCYLYADTTTNPPVFLASKPNSNAFSVRILTNESPDLLFSDANGAQLPEYVLTLSFERVH
jgi:hypothetical protein